MANRVQRREFISILGAGVALPFAALAQQTGQMRRIGVLMNLTKDDAEGQARVAAFVKGLRDLGWIEGHNLHIDYRWGHPTADRIRNDAAELVALTPNVILSSGNRFRAAVSR